MTDAEARAELILRGVCPEAAARARISGGVKVPAERFLDVTKTLPKLTEEAFQAAVIGIAHGHGWHVAHFRKARTAKGWVTPVAADGRGFPDLVLVRDRVIWAELKVPPNRLRPDQEIWRDWLLAAGQDWYCWYPKDMAEIEDRLR